MDNVPDMTTENGQQAVAEQQMRDAMVQQLIELGAARDPRVVAAFRAVPRHLATPGVDMAKTYQAESATITKADADGSPPWKVAVRLSRTPRARGSFNSARGESWPGLSSSTATEWASPRGNRPYGHAPRVRPHSATEPPGPGVNAFMYWDGGHGANEDAADFIEWIAKVTGHKS